MLILSYTHTIDCVVADVLQIMLLMIYKCCCKLSCYCYLHIYRCANDQSAVACRYAYYCAHLQFADMQLFAHCCRKQWTMICRFTDLKYVAAIVNNLICVVFIRCCCVSTVTRTSLKCACDFAGILT
ncbi:hypothetical protein QVD17_11908 [Tagetes erecta]|uniref:Uncharacterized protein n=1 Tax=Tagetes erecta TaxID=13708 RepID=A0AAD8P1B3_TARER|nr:hypothetical protein QVD17_11908 [Tagetes erecta]